MPSDFDHRKCPNCAGRSMRLTRVEPRRSRRGSAGALSRVSALVGSPIQTKLSDEVETLELMRPRIVRSPSTFASAPGRAMQRSHALGQRQRHYQSPPFIALAMIGPTPGTVINCRSMVELYERRGVRFPGSQWS